MRKEHWWSSELVDALKHCYINKIIGESLLLTTVRAFNFIHSYFILCDSPQGDKTAEMLS